MSKTSSPAVHSVSNPPAFLSAAYQAIEQVWFIDNGKDGPVFVMPIAMSAEPPAMRLRPLYAAANHVLQLAATQAYMQRIPEQQRAEALAKMAINQGEALNAYVARVPLQLLLTTEQQREFLAAHRGAAYQVSVGANAADVAVPSPIAHNAAIQQAKETLRASLGELDRELLREGSEAYPGFHVGFHGAAGEKLPADFKPNSFQDIAIATRKHLGSLHAEEAFHAMIDKAKVGASGRSENVSPKGVLGQYISDISERNRFFRRRVLRDARRKGTLSKVLSALESPKPEMGRVPPHTPQENGDLAELARESAAATAARLAREAEEAEARQRHEEAAAITPKPFALSDDAKEGVAILGAPSNLKQNTRDSATLLHESITQLQEQLAHAGRLPNGTTEDEQKAYKAECAQKDALGALLLNDHTIYRLAKALDLGDDYRCERPLETSEEKDRRLGRAHHNGKTDAVANARSALYVRNREALQNDPALAGMLRELCQDNPVVALLAAAALRQPTHSAFDFGREVHGCTKVLPLTTLHEAQQEAQPESGVRVADLVAFAPFQSLLNSVLPPEVGVEAGDVARTTAVGRT